jgi:hypothetical protein
MSANLLELRPAQMLASAGNDSFRGRVRGRLRLKNERTKTVLRGPRERKSNPRRPVSRCSQSFFNRNRPRPRPRPYSRSEVIHRAGDESVFFAFERERPRIVNNFAASSQGAMPLRPQEKHPTPRVGGAEGASDDVITFAFPQ